MERKKELLLIDLNESIKDLEQTIQRLKNKKENFTIEKITNIIQDLDYYDIKLRKYWM